MRLSLREHKGLIAKERPTAGVDCSLVKIKGVEEDEVEASVVAKDTIMAAILDCGSLCLFIEKLPQALSQWSMTRGERERDVF